MEDLLNENLVLLTKNLSNTLEVLIHLRQRKIISENELQLVENKRTDLEKNVEMITLLMKKGDDKLPIFMGILRNTGNDHLVKAIEEKAKDSNPDQLLLTATVAPNTQTEIIQTEPGPSKRQRLSPSVLHAAKNDHLTTQLKETVKSSHLEDLQQMPAVQHEEQTAQYKNGQHQLPSACLPNPSPQFQQQLPQQPYPQYQPTYPEPQNFHPQHQNSYLQQYSLPQQTYYPNQQPIYHQHQYAYPQPPPLYPQYQHHYLPIQHQPISHQSQLSYSQLQLPQSKNQSPRPNFETLEHENEPVPSNRQNLPSSLQNAADPNNEQFEKLLESKWWPEKKDMIKSFYDRKVDGQLIIEKLYSLLQENDNKTTVITQDTLVVSGLGGIGKTSIAKSFANHYEGEYDYIIWIDCGEGSLIKSFRMLAIDLQVDSRVERLEDLARKCFSKLRNCKCLIIYDNAECYVGNEGIRDVLPKYEGTNNLHSIITSRNQEWGTNTGYGKINKFHMNVFSDDESSQFMEKALTDVQFNHSQLQRLGELLGHLPLALQIAVATLNTQQITITEYIEQLAMEDGDIINENFDDYEHTINKTMNISLAQIQKDKNGRIAYNILMNFGYIQPDDVELLFLQRIENIRKVDIEKGVAVLEKYSLVSVHQKYKGNNKRESRYVSIHRLLQQVIRHNGQDQENDKLRKILSCKGLINYKLIPYSYAENHKDLKIEFSHIRSQLIDQVKLTELLKERRFKEAVQLSLMIHNSFDKLESEKRYLLSKYNHAVCLENNGQISESMEVFKSFSDDLESNSVDNWFEKLDAIWILEQQTGFGLRIKSLNDILPDKLIIDAYIDLYQGNFNSVVQSLRENNFQKGSVEEWLRVLHFGLMGMNSNNCHSNSAVEIANLIDEMVKYEYRKGVVNFTTWLQFLDILVKVTTKMLSDKSCHDALKKLFSVAKRFMFSFTFEEFQRNSSRWEEIETNLQKNFETEGKMQTVENICDLFMIIRNESVAIGDPHIINQETESVGNYFAENWSTETTTFSDGEFTYKRTIYDISFIRFPDPKSLTKVTLNGIVIFWKDLCHSFTGCSNLVQVVLKDIRFWGTCSYKVELPKLKHFELELSRGECEGLNCDGTDRYTFFAVRDLCIWESISKLDYYKIKLANDYAFTEFSKESQQLRFSQVTIDKAIPYHLFCKLQIVDSKVAITSDSGNEQCCRCTNCSSIYNPDVIISNGKAINRNRKCHSNIMDIKLVRAQFFNVDTNESQSLSHFLIRFSDLIYIEINCGDGGVDLYEDFMPCTNVVKIVLRNAWFLGTDGYKVAFPNIKHFELVLTVDDYAPINIFGGIDNYTFFAGRDLCIWESIRKLDYYKIALPNVGFILFEKESQKLTFRGSILDNNIPCHLFRLLRIESCTVSIVSEDEQKCSCTNCRSSVNVHGVTSNREVVNDSGHYSSNTHTIELYETKFVDVNSKVSLPLTSFLNRFNNLTHLKIVECDIVVNLMDLTHIEVVVIWHTRLVCRDRCNEPINPSLPSKMSSIPHPEMITSESTNADEKAERVISCTSKRQKKIVLYRVTPVELNGSEGVEQKTIDFSSLNVDELQWNGYYLNNNYYCMLDKLPAGIQKLSLIEVAMKYSESDNSLSTHLKSLSKTPSTLKTLDLRGSELDLQCVLPSVKILKLREVKLVGEIFDESQLKLHKLILINYGLEDLEKQIYKSLLNYTENVVIQTRTKDFKKIVNSFPYSVKSAFFGNRYYKGMHFYRLDSGDSWSRRQITEEEFEEQI